MTLETIIKKRKRRQMNFSDIEIREIVTTVLIAISYMHSKGVCHRDLRPGIYFKNFANF